MFKHGDIISIIPSFSERFKSCGANGEEDELHSRFWYGSTRETRNPMSGTSIRAILLHLLVVTDFNRNKFKSSNIAWRNLQADVDFCQASCNYRCLPGSASFLYCISTLRRAWCMD